MASSYSASPSFVYATARSSSLRSPPATILRLRSSRCHHPRRQLASFTNPSLFYFAGELGLSFLCTVSWRQLDSEKTVAGVTVIRV
ncbi:unnamed protein product [Brassica napus]|uniref:(rape) hypothetical protein n=1 Tax=Brassica napus TaxID=3708 RepID=A0A816N7R4_BRANA|nr:unnamed protein product [Brassica napus]